MSVEPRQVGVERSAPRGAVFLSYASQDAEAAKRICEALRAAGVEVWFDQSELVGGDAWDQKIRKQIRDCALFVPLISAHTQERAEGYFRLEWHLAEQRTYLMAHDQPFLFPVIIDDTTEAEARVPDRFRERQWTRLPQGKTAEQFCDRVKTLLGGDSARSGAQRSSARSIPGNETPTRVTTKSRRLSPFWLSLVIPAVWVWWYIAHKPELKSPTEVSGAVAPSAKVAVTEVDRLLGQIWGLVYHHGMARAELEAADQLCRRAAELDATNADVWAAWAHVHTWLIYHRFDETDARRLAAQDCASRAMRLAQNSFEARLAQAMYWLRGRGNNEAQVKEARQILRALLQEKPDDSRGQFLLGDSLLQDSQTRDEGMELLGRAAGNPQMASVAWMEIGWNHYFGARFAEADRAIDRSIAAGAYWNNCSLKMRLALQWHGDLAAAKTWLEKLPATDLQDDFVVAHQFMLYTWRREPERVIPLLQIHPREWLSSNPYRGPKSLLLGLARRMAGQETAGRKEFRLALDLIEARLRDNPNDGNLLSQKAEVLFYLGDRPVADAACRQVREVSSLGLNLRVLFDPADKVIDFLEGMFDRPSFAMTAASLRLDPLYDPIRVHPRFQALIGRAEASPRHTPAPLASLPPVTDAKSVAVLAFANLSDDKGNEYFSDGISEELLNVLAKIPGLKVTARTSSFHFKGKDTPIPEIAAQLGVAYVVEGSVRKQGDKVRITAQLIKAADGFHVWSDTFTRDLKDIFAVQDEIAGLISQQLQLKLTATERAKRVVDPEAYRLVLEGRQFWNLRTEEGFAKAETAFTKSLTIDPQFAEAHAGLAGVYVIRCHYRELDAVPLEANDLVRAVSEGRRALEIDPSSAEAHAVLGAADYFANRRGDSDRHFQQALTLSPNSALVHCWYALLLSGQGRLDASLQHYQVAAELDPLWFINLQMLGGELAFAQRFDQSLGIIERAAALRTGIFLPNLAGRALALLALGRKEEAFEAARHILRHPDDRPRWNSDAVAIRVLWEGGRRQEAGDEVARLLARWPPDFYLRGFALVAVGRFDEALPYLKHTPSSMLRSLYWESMWDPWRDDPRFAQLLQNFNRTEEYKVARATLARMQQEQAAKK